MVLARALVLSFSSRKPVGVPLPVQLQPSHLMSTNISESTTSKFVAWLNKHYPHLAVVMYDIGARYGIHYLYLELLN